MARYREKRPLGEVEAIFYTGDNVEEIKDFLGDNFVKIGDEYGRGKIISFERFPYCPSQDFLHPQIDMIVKYDREVFGAVNKNDFLDNWGEVE